VTPSAKKGTAPRRPSSRTSRPSPFELEFPEGSESANAAVIALVQTHSAVSSVLDSVNRELGVSSAGRRLLAVLEAAAVPLSATTISARLLVTTASITSLLDTLERQGLIARAPDPADRRKILVSITPAGRRLVDLFLPQIVALQTALLEGISEADRKHLVATLTAIKATADGLDPLAVSQAAPARGKPRHD